MRSHHLVAARVESPGVGWSRAREIRRRGEPPVGGKREIQKGGEVPWSTDIDVRFDEAKLAATREQPTQLRAGQSALPPHAFDEITVLASEATMPICLAMAPAVLDERFDREPASDLMQLRLVT